MWKRKTDPAPWFPQTPRQPNTFLPDPHQPTTSPYPIHQHVTSGYSIYARYCSPTGIAPHRCKHWGRLPANVTLPPPSPSPYFSAPCVAHAPRLVFRGLFLSFLVLFLFLFSIFGMRLSLSHSAPQVLSIPSNLPGPLFQEIDPMHVI